jgi:hypothetical protein
MKVVHWISTQVYSDAPFLRRYSLVSIGFHIFCTSSYQRPEIASTGFRGIGIAKQRNTASYGDYLFSIFTITFRKLAEAGVLLMTVLSIGVRALIILWTIFSHRQLLYRINNYPILITTGPWFRINMPESLSSFKFSASLYFCRTHIVTLSPPESS